MKACVLWLIRFRFSKYKKKFEKLKFFACKNVRLCLCIFSDLDWNKLPLTYYANDADKTFSFDVIQKKGYTFYVSSYFTNP